jgi:two-component system alkaline phosphatase synthesis response regulator PhoP
MMALQILIADDAPHIARSLSFVLQKEGFSVDVANTGEEALKKIREERPKVVFLDIVMPKMTGLDICKEINTDPTLKDTYIIILTAKGGDMDRQECMSAGADEYMTNPFSPREVLEQVLKLFSRG